MPNGDCSGAKRIRTGLTCSAYGVQSPASPSRSRRSELRRCSSHWAPDRGWSGAVSPDLVPVMLAAAGSLPTSPGRAFEIKLCPCRHLRLERPGQGPRPGPETTSPAPTARQLSVTSSGPLLDHFDQLETERVGLQSQGGVFVPVCERTKLPEPGASMFGALKRGVREGERR